MNERTHNKLHMGSAFNLFHTVVVGGLTGDGRRWIRLLTQNIVEGTLLHVEDGQDSTVNRATESRKQLRPYQ